MTNDAPYDFIETESPSSNSDNNSSNENTGSERSTSERREKVGVGGGGEKVETRSEIPMKYENKTLWERVKEFLFGN